MSQQTAIITGASRGLGRDMALNLAKDGIHIIFSYHTNDKKAKEVILEIESIGQKAVAFPFDANNYKSGQEFMVKATDYLKQQNGNPNFDFLINNAGTGTFNLTSDTTEEQFDEMMNVHLKSVYFLTQKALPYLNRGGRIINISSGLTRFSLPGMSAYAMMKGGIEVFTRYLAKELGQHKITANVIAPGAIATDFAGGSNRDNEEKRAIIANITALGRVGEAEDIGGTVAFLCSDKAGWINGQRIEVSGGMLV
ncbi:NAD(P)-dependent dehydrogenase (short-subunit alcohol dehydrogenase family) [Aquimarina sp. EL_43]|uniref:SDR family NAD(P)-dependent oxidoreductase n=1 Tax=unclassified Aquimarina TaxID=2627091 RepID=UPI0018C96D81|nr:MULTISPECIES: SDR family oxidoreductase [unclassified Aquimarina]MBG6130012.1 NAD(P)-dependent dehydrogenase (short-subunit alcohol dehydrogenase family) [Aquimarina sp. EL_35]MBG6148792.1 NAD(P)-dependent dehydrogenase (short-subunit alcohol dehydrogenase family) [Aquimarina sp. EL_32]MBG6168834.1 NAD(P)-dependent dehydrogenase (short-subunit alcohol dehydrogenase family) [Aquimarina sp. EL_43]